MLPVAVNYYAVLGATVAAMIVGSIWYMPQVFGNRWMKLVGKKQGDMSGIAKTMVWTVLATLLSAYVLAHIIGYAGAATTTAGIQTAFWVWLGFVAPLIGINFLYEGRSRDLYILVVGHHLAVLLVMGAILGHWS